MKSQLIVAGVAVAAAGALGLCIPAAEHVRHQDVTPTSTSSLGDINTMILGLEGVSAWSNPGTPLGEVAATSTDFYNVITSGSTASGMFAETDNTVAAQDLLNSSDITGANQAAGIGYTNGYIGLSPTTTPDTFTFMDQLGADYDHGLQALLTAFNQPLISYEDAANVTTPGAYDPTMLNLDPAELGTTASPLTLANDLTVAYQDFVGAADLAFGITP
jgi:hypothetical protein